MKTIYAFTPPSLPTEWYLPFVNLSEGMQADKVVLSVRTAGINPAVGTMTLDREQIKELAGALSKWVADTERG